MNQTPVSPFSTAPPPAPNAAQGSVQPGVSFLASVACKQPLSATASLTNLLQLALAMFGVVSRRFDRSHSVPSTSMDPGKEAQRQNPSAIVYQQSSTRKLAFGGNTDVEADKKPMDDFYNNSTLTNVTKVFCAVVLLTAFFLVMSRSFNIDFPQFSLN